VIKTIYTFYSGSSLIFLHFILPIILIGCLHYLKKNTIENPLLYHIILYTVMYAGVVEISEIVNNFLSIYNKTLVYSFILSVCYLHSCLSMIDTYKRFLLTVMALFYSYYHTNMIEPKVKAGNEML
jgi:hypothetical protein